jgi:protein tyrosine phosphatase (PTP) superfamily phosphohydrolase (DUF442 family)
MSLREITNYLQVSERIASSGQPEEEQFRDIAKSGYGVVINLAMPNSTNAIPEEGNIVSALKMAYLHIPVPFEAPEASHLRAFIGSMQVFSDRKIWVHCVVNYRVSAFLYQYWRLALGAAPEEARKVMLPSWEPNEVWRKFMALSRADLGA